MRSATILELDDPRWHAFLRAVPRPLPFHHPTWAKLLAECYGYSAFALAVLNEDGGVAAGLPVLEVPGLIRGKRWVSLPFTDHCPPLGGAAQATLAEALDVARRSTTTSKLEVRGALPGGSVQSVPSGVLHVLDLVPDAEEVFQTFKRTQVQQPIMQAERNGITIRRGRDPADLTETFYRLHVLTRRRLGVPVQPRRFFELLWQRAFAEGLGFVLVASTADEPIAAAVFLEWRGYVTYKYSASDPRFWRLRPNNLLLWRAIRGACENGCYAFDFGRTDAGNKGLRTFKRGWGTREERLVYSVLGRAGDNASSPHLSELAKRIIRVAPTWFCRGAGELLYRYSA